MENITLDHAIEIVMQLPVEQQDMLLDILYHRRIEKCRQEMAQSAKKALAAFREGKLRAQPSKAVIQELRASLAEE
jgi:hypothetical protein